MPRFDAPVQAGTQAVLHLEELIAGDLDPQRTGFGWWAGYSTMSPEDRGWLSYYLTGAVAGIGSNLVDAAAHLALYQDAVRREAIFYARQVRAAGGREPDMNHRNDIDELRRITIIAERKGFFRALGSTLDTLAATVIGVGAINLNLVRADWGWLCITGSEQDYPRTPGQDLSKLRKALVDDTTSGGAIQDTLLQAVRGAVRAAGPAHWDEWLGATRNTQVHRSQWTEILVQVDRRNPEAGVHRPLPRQPQLVEGVELQTTAAMHEMLLTEDASVTMAGLLDSVVAVVQAVTGACEATWNRRRADPRVLPQPFGSTWLPAVVPQFDGYDPTHARKAFDAATAILVSPSHAKRITALKRP
ncbi:hypothetical protein [Nocardia tengchongensis]